VTIAEAREKCKGAMAKMPRDILVIAIVVLASSASFGLGYLAGIDAGLSVQAGQGSLLSSLSTAPGTDDQVVASKGGTKYYFPSCTGVAGISDQNKVWFASASAAEAAGYTRAANCTNI
jgi:hypothetical protein